MSYWENINKNDEWYTPKYVFNALDVIFDLDVAHPNINKNITPSNKVICENSLEKVWNGFIWMNPPFGKRNGLLPWLEKFFEHGNGIALTPDRTSAPWYHYCLNNFESLLIVNHKIKFTKPDGSKGKSPSTGTTLWAIGDKGNNALMNAKNNNLGFLLNNESKTSYNK